MMRCCRCQCDPCDCGHAAYHGHAPDVLRLLPAESVNCCVTSPPYWGLRDYGIPPSVWDGDPDHEHMWREHIQPATDGSLLVDGNAAAKAGHQGTISATMYPKKSAFCECGAWFGCFGLEPTPDLYVQHAVQIFREVRRVLSADGTLWLNLGDSYANDGKSGSETNGKHSYLPDNDRRRVGREKRFTGLKPKDLVGIPWAVAFALRSDGWYLRQEIIWHKPAPMPESVKDRCTKAHEQIFLLSKSPRYFFDAAAIAEDCQGSPGDNLPDDWARANNRKRQTCPTPRQDQITVPKVPYAWAVGPGDHTSIDHQTPGNHPKSAVRKVNGGACFGKQRHDAAGTGAQSRTFERPVYENRNRRSVWTVAGANFAGAHFATFPPRLIEPCILAGCPEGGTVIDPFAGAFTTAMVAQANGRKSIGIELNAEYITLGLTRLQQEMLF